nr:hypothetical protein CFP56_50723 [Quercus suber]
MGKDCGSDIGKSDELISPKPTSEEDNCNTNKNLEFNEIDMACPELVKDSRAGGSRIVAASAVDSRAGGSRAVAASSTGANSERVVVPTLEKAIQRMQAKKKKKPWV